MDQLLTAFISETRDNLESASQIFLELENSPGDRDLLNDLFRNIHTIKGGSGLFEISAFTKVVHTAEDLLDAAREGQLIVNSDMIDLFLSVMDQISLWLEELENHGSLGSDAGDISAELNNKLKAIATETLGEDYAKDKPVDTGITAVTSTPSWAQQLVARNHQQLKQLSEKGTTAVYGLEFRPNTQCFFNGLDPLHSIKTTPNLNAFTAFNVIPWPTPESLDPYKCHLGFYAISSATKEQLQHHYRYVIDDITLYNIELSSVLPNISVTKPTVKEANVNQGLTSKPEVTSELIEASKKIIAAQQRILSDEGEQSAIEGRVGAVGETLNRVLHCLNMKSAQQQLAEITETGPTKASGQALENFINTLDIDALLNTIQSPESPPKLDNNQASLSVVPKPQDRRKSDRRSQDERRLDGDRRSDSTNLITAANKELKVDQSRIDKLMDLIGELVVAKNSLPFLAKRAEEEFGVRELAKEIKSQYSVINRLSEELQSAMMQVRMVPVSSVFKRFPRLVRDLSRKLGKNIKLVTEGEDTEADKNIIEELSDPLIHLVRNSLDHGLETPEERKASGKPETGKLTLRAIPFDDQVAIEVEDDGRGIDPEFIRKKAIDKKIITEEEAQNLSDQEALQLIFAAGFSTAESLSDISGRGVGMDVVRSAITAAGGNVVIDSVKHRGTRLRLTLPLSMAISRVMMIKCNQQHFGIGMDMISETVRVRVKDIQRIKQTEAVVLRNKLTPLFRLRDLLGVLDSEEQEEVAVVVLNLGGEAMGLVIDDFLGSIDIIVKPLEGLMNNLKLYSGAALLGDGSVLLVLNILELLTCQSNIKKA